MREADGVLSRIVSDWLATFETALATNDAHSLAVLFHDDCHWRDALALTWTLTTISDRNDALAALQAQARDTKARNFRLDPKRTPPRCVTRVGRDVIEAIFAFETGDGPCNGVIRLIEENGEPKAWTLFTALDSLTPAEADARHAKAHARDFRGPNWRDLRIAHAAYADRDPAVLVVGGGQAGLAAAARLTHLGVDTLIVDREARIGDNWRNRYHALTLHNQVQVNHMPLMPFPPGWPTYIPKDKLANWFESYVEALELNFWTATEFEGGDYDEPRQRWTVTLRRADGERRTMHPRHVIMATGVSGIPNRPAIPSLGDFNGAVLHSSQYQDGDTWAGKRALVIGTGNSGHDIAQDLHAGDAEVTLVQRSPTLVTNLEPAQLAYALYDEGPPLEDCDLLAASMPVKLSRQTHVKLTEQAKRLDADLLDGLAQVGFKLDDGEDGTGWQFKYLTRGGGYYFNVGCADLVAAGAVGLLQFDEIERFEPEGARLRDGSLKPADLIVLATGYKGQEVLVRKLFGEAVADRVGPIWGFGDSQELRAMYRRTGQPGLWFIAGSLAQCRINSKFLALQIKAIETGRIPAREHGISALAVTG